VMVYGVSGKSVSTYVFIWLYYARAQFIFTWHSNFHFSSSFVATGERSNLMSHLHVFIVSPHLQSVSSKASRLIELPFDSMNKRNWLRVGLRPSYLLQCYKYCCCCSLTPCSVCGMSRFRFRSTPLSCGHPMLVGFLLEEFVE
jgi:hypothetical protein